MYLMIKMFHDLVSSGGSLPDFRKHLLALSSPDGWSKSGPWGLFASCKGCTVIVGSPPEAPIFHCHHMEGDSFREGIWRIQMCSPPQTLHPFRSTLLYDSATVHKRIRHQLLPFLFFVFTFAFAITNTTE